MTLHTPPVITTKGHGDMTAERRCSRTNRSLTMARCLVLLLLTTCLLSFCNPVASIRCFKCDHNEISSGNSFLLSLLLKQLSKVDHPECKMKSRSDRYDIDIVECPPPSDYGYKYVCGTVRGTVSGEWKDLQVQFDTLVRDCTQVPTGESGYHDRCVETALMDGPTQYLVQEAIEALGDFQLSADINFKGKTCYDTHGVPDNEHQKVCPTCSYNEILSVNSLLGPLVDAFNKNNEESCRLQHPSDKLGVGYRICKAAYQGEVNKCALVQGEVTAKLLRGVGGGIDVRYNTVSRGCAQLDMSGQYRDMYKDGCHTQLPFSEPVRKIIVQGYKGASTKMGDITLKGKVCYNNFTSLAVKPTVKAPEKQKETASAAQHLTMTSLPVCAAFLTYVVKRCTQL